MRYHMVGPRPTKLGVNISHIVRHLYLEFENSSSCGSCSTLSLLERGIFRVWPPCNGAKPRYLADARPLRGGSRAERKTKESLIPSRGTEVQSAIDKWHLGKTALNSHFETKNF